MPAVAPVAAPPAPITFLPPSRVGIVSSVIGHSASEVIRVLTSPPTFSACTVTFPVHSSAGSAVGFHAKSTVSQLCAHE